MCHYQTWLNDYPSVREDYVTEQIAKMGDALGFIRCTDRHKHNAETYSALSSHLKQLRLNGTVGNWTLYILDPLHIPLTDKAWSVAVKQHESWYS